MDKGKSLIWGEEEVEALATTNYTVDASFLAPMPLMALETGHSGQTTSSDVMQFWHDFSKMHNSPLMDDALNGANPEVPCLIEDVSLKTSLPKRSDEDLFSMLLNMERPSSDHTASPNAMTGSEPPFGMASQLPAFAEGISNEELGNGLQQKQCMDGLSSIVPRSHASASVSGYSVRRQNMYSDTKLAEIALHDPQRAKRIMANRQSALRCQQNKACHMSELEQKERNLRMETARLSSRIIVENKFRSALAFKNNDLMLRLQTMELKAKLQDAKTDSLRAEIQRLRTRSGQEMMDGGNSSHGWKYCSD